MGIAKGSREFVENLVNFAHAELQKSKQRLEEAAKYTKQAYDNRNSIMRQADDAIYHVAEESLKIMGDIANSYIDTFKSIDKEISHLINCSGKQLFSWFGLTTSCATDKKRAQERRRKKEEQETREKEEQKRIEEQRIKELREQEERDLAEADKVIDEAKIQESLAEQDVQVKTADHENALERRKNLK